MPSSISEPITAVPTMSATSAITKRTTSVSSTRSASGRPPLTRMSRATQDRQPREQDEEDGPAPAEHAPQRDVDERHDDGHRRTR